MARCACCGQVVASTASVTIRVDDELLRLCNRAHDEALRLGHAHVDIALLILCMAREARYELVFQAHGIEREAAVLGAERWLTRNAVRGARTSATASDDLKSLLRRAQQMAEKEQRSFAQTGDVLRALVTDDAGLGSAAFMRSSRWSAREQSTGRRAELGQSRAVPYSTPLGDDGNRLVCSSREPRYFDAAASDIGYQRAGYASARSRSEARLLDELADRMARLERELADLTKLMAARQSGMEALPPRSDADAAERHLASGYRRSDAPSASGRSGHGRGPARDGSGLARSRSFSLASWNRRLRRRKKAERRSDRRQADREAVAHADDRQLSRHDLAWERALALVGREREGGPLSATQDRHKRELENRGDVETEEEAELDCASDDDADAHGDRPKRFYLSLDDDIVRAPSIGPRTAERLAAARLLTVRDLLQCDPEQVARKVGSRYITATRIADWQAQARLVCTIPWLRGTHAQLLVGGGYRSLDQIIPASINDVQEAIAAFAQTREGMSCLRSGPPPGHDRVARWLEHAGLAEPDRAMSEPAGT